MSLQPPYLPVAVDPLRAAFPTSVADLMPAREDIPEDFYRDRGDARPWVKFQRDWFFFGLKGAKLAAKPGIDLNVAIRHLQTIQGSWEPKHEDKEAAVAYLASLWLEPPVYGRGEPDRLRELGWRVDAARRGER